MNLLSKFSSRKYMGFLYCLTAFFASINVAYGNTADIKSETAETQTSSSPFARKDMFSEILESISVREKPYKDLPGYWHNVESILDENRNFNITITNTEKNQEFPADTYSMKNLKGNVVILFFTTTWCPNCTSVFKELDKLNQDLAKSKIDNVKIMPVVLGMDSDEAVSEYYKKNGIESLHKFRSISPMFLTKIYAVPTCIVFNKKSVPVWGFSGITNYRALDFVNFIESLVKEN